MDSPEFLITLDTETTGVNVYADRIVTAYIAKVNRTGDVVESYEWLLDPVIEITDGAAEAHGITTEYAREHGMIASKGIAEINATITRLTDGIPLVVYNAPFDLTLLRQETDRWNLAQAVFGPVIDPLVIWKAVDKYRKGKRTLTAAAEAYGIPFENAHDASADAKVAAAVAFELLPEVASFIGIDYDWLLLMNLQKKWKAEQAASLQAYFRSDKNPNGADPGAIVEGGWPVYGA